jgi:sialate O-acetylesterase
LTTADGKQLRGFYVSADGANFLPGTARIEADKIVVSSNEVATPVAVRYGADMGKERLDVNFTNREKLPASPFTIIHQTMNRRGK